MAHAACILRGRLQEWRLRMRCADRRPCMHSNGLNAGVRPCTAPVPQQLRPLRHGPCCTGMHAMDAAATPAASMHADSSTSTSPPANDPQRGSDSAHCGASSGAGSSNQEAGAVSGPRAPRMRTRPSEAERVLRALGRYAPTGLWDGPTSLLKYMAVDAGVLRGALAEGAPLLRRRSLRQLAGIAGGVAASGQRHAGFEAALEEAVIVRLDELISELLALASQPSQQAGSGGRGGAQQPPLLAGRGSNPWSDVCYLAASAARLGARQPQLWERLAAAGENGVAPPLFAAAHIC